MEIVATYKLNSKLNSYLVILLVSLLTETEAFKGEGVVRNLS